MCRKFSVIILATLAILSILVLPPTKVYAEGEGSECWAVIIDVVDYQYIDGFWSGLRDGPDLCRQLQPGFGGEHIELLTNANATKANIRDAMLNWLDPREDRDDTVLLFFSGHGCPEYIAPYDSLTTSYANDISSNELAVWLDSLESMKIAIFLNSCESGSFINELSKSGRVILTSSAENEGSWAYKSLPHSVFVHFILQAFSKWETVDANKNYEMSAEEIFGYAAPAVAAFFQHDLPPTPQHPVISDQYPGEFGLLMKVIFQIADSIPEGFDVFVLDGKKYPDKTELILAPGTSHELTVFSPLGASSTRFVFTSWENGETSTSRKISRGGLYSLNYKKQYELILESGYGKPEGAGWYDVGTQATISVSPLIEEQGTRYVFLKWVPEVAVATPASTTSVTMTSPKKVSADWRTDHLLTLTSAYNKPEGAGWYESGATVTISIAPIKGILVRQIFTVWSGDYSGTTPTATLTINSPMAVTANWRTDYIQLYILGIVVLAAVTAAVAYIIEKRRELY